MWKRLLAAIAFGLVAYSALVQPAAAASGGTAHDKTVPSLLMEILEDVSTQMTLEQVQSASGWTTLPGQPAIGFSRSVFWLRITPQLPEGTTREWRLVTDILHVDDIRLYQQSGDGGWTEQRAGRSIPQMLWPLDTRTPVFAVEFTPQNQTLYLRMQSLHSLWGTIHLHSEEEFRQENVKEALFFGGFFGVFAVVILLQLLHWLRDRDSRGSWYTIYLVILLLASLHNTGYLPSLLKWTSFQSAMVAGILLCMTPLAMFKLTEIWLELDRYLPRLGRAYQYAVFSTCLFTSALVVLGDYTLGVQITQGTMLVWMVGSLLMALWLWKHMDVYAGSYLLVFGFIDLGIGARYLHNFGLLPVNIWSKHSLFIGIALHLLAMSLYYIHRYGVLQSSLKLEQQAREEQRDFVGMVSHEFRTPLAIINTSIQVLAANLDAPAEKSLQRAQNIRAATQRLTQLMDDYLSIDRLDSAHQPVRLRACDFYEVVEEVTSDWSVDRICIHTHDLPPSFVCDPELMHIVLRNLLANADRHAPPGSVIDLHVDNSNKGVLTIQVQDHGEGIPGDELPRLFQKYVRGRNTQGKPGAGLGLYLVHRIVTAHGGTIQVQSTLGQGTMFTIQIPPGTLPRS